MQKIASQLLLFFSILFLVAGCSYTERHYVKSELPVLEKYETNSSISPTVYKYTDINVTNNLKEDVRRFQNVTIISNEDFRVVLSKYIDMQEALRKHNKQVDLYEQLKE